MIFNVGCAFRGRARAEPDGLEAMLFVQLARGGVLLMRVKLQPGWIQHLRKENEPRPPTFAPLGRVDEHPINVRTPHRQKGNNVVVARTNPDVATGADYIPEDFSGSFQRERLPGRKEPVRRSSRTVPHANDSRLILILERPDGRTRVIHG
jgi:hypothetical protein